MKRTDDFKIFITNRDSICDEYGGNLGRKAWITLKPDKGALCLACADMDHLVFLPSGNTALTRRAHKHSRLSAVVLKWSRTRKRYERQGLLVDETAYDDLLATGLDRWEARNRVEGMVNEILNKWKQ